MRADKCPNCGAYLPAPRPGQTSIVTKGNPHDCGRPTVRLPICSVAQVWQRALAAGAPKNAVATVSYEIMRAGQLVSPRSTRIITPTPSGIFPARAP